MGSEAEVLGPLLGGSATLPAARGPGARASGWYSREPMDWDEKHRPHAERPCEETLDLCVEVVGGGDGRGGGAPPSSPLLCTPAGPSVSKHSRLFTGIRMTKKTNISEMVNVKHIFSLWKYTLPERAERGLGVYRTVELSLYWVRGNASSRFLAGESRKGRARETNPGSRTTTLPNPTSRHFLRLIDFAHACRV